MKNTTTQRIESLRPGILTKHIQFIRQHRVLLDSDLANLYGVPTKVLIQAVKRNSARFPNDFMFQLTEHEWNDLRSQLVTSRPGHGGRRFAPYAFTEQGVAMLSSVLNSQPAIDVNIEIMRAFVHLRESMASNKELTLRVDELESKTELIEFKRDKFEQNARLHFKQVFEVIRELMATPEPPKKRPIGFIIPAEKPTKKKTTKKINPPSPIDHT